VAKKRIFFWGGVFFVEMMLCVACQCSVVLFEGFWLFLLYSVFLWGSYCWGFAQSLFLHGSENWNKID